MLQRCGLSFVNPGSCLHGGSSTVLVFTRGRFFVFVGGTNLPVAGAGSAFSLVVSFLGSESTMKDGRNTSGARAIILLLKRRHLQLDRMQQYYHQYCIHHCKL
jgi:hypothetical protein